MILPDALGFGINSTHVARQNKHQLACGHNLAGPCPQVTVDTTTIRRLRTI
jgi:hypothetical protein